jgi:hypothetical protein
MGETPSGLGVYTAIVAVSAELAQVGIPKSRENKQQGYRFRGIDEVQNVLAPLLAKYSLVIIPRCMTRTSVERQTKNGGALFYATVEVQFDFVSALDNSIHTACTFGEAMDSGDKATNKAMSAAYKYAVFQTFCVPVEGDNDADATTHDVAPKRELKADTSTAKVSAEQLKRLTGMLKAHNTNVPEFKAWVEKKFGVTDSRNILRKDYDLIVKWVVEGEA